MNLTTCNSTISSFIQKAILFLLLLKVSLLSFGQNTDSSFHLVKNIAGHFSYFNVDPLQNLYLINDDNQLKKLNTYGDSAGVFNKVRNYGKLTDIDATNPLKLLLFYKDFSTMVVLDRFLNLRNTINLRKQNIVNVKTVATSYDNNFWLFDEGDAKIKKLNDDGNILLETVDLRTVLDTVPSPDKIIDCDGLLYLYDSTKGFYIFDYYGVLLTKLSLRGWKNVSVYNKQIFSGIHDNCLYKYDLSTGKTTTFDLPQSFSSSIDIKISINKIYIMYENEIKIFETDTKK